MCAPVRVAPVRDLYLRKDRPDVQRAEACYREAIAIAIDDEARSKQLRAATSLATLWLTQGRSDAARELLEPLYNTFDEGFDMLDMRNARAMLERLGVAVS